LNEEEDEIRMGLGRARQWIGFGPVHGHSHESAGGEEVGCQPTSEERMVENTKARLKAGLP